ncbi:MAG TPA: FAD-dependent oxidoreductase [Xanthobacteraceae bacterium]|jgi:2-polyprenyl-6-methoxyphenol hydroxylase-like FAD-dependent oxidoreductase
MPAVNNVLVVGGGIAGMTAAIALKRAGIQCGIAEINPRWTVIGVGISLQGPALRALAMVGVLDRCITKGFGYSHFKACDADGRLTGTVQLPRLNGPRYPATIGVMRQAVHEVLQDALAAAGVKVRLGVTVSALAQHDDHVSVGLSDGTRADYDLVVGADGANSKVRELVFGGGSKPQYTGQAVWRATVRRPAEIEARYSFFGPRNKAGFNPVSAAEMYVYLVQNLPEFIRVPDDQLPEVMREQLTDFRGPLAAAREEIVDPRNIVYRPVTSGIMPTPWYRGRVVVIGDAAHATTPHMAAGAGLAVEDSVVLAQLLGADQALPDLLKTFMSRRHERCRMVVDNSFQLGEWEKNPGAPEADPVGMLDKSLKALAQPF